MVAMTTVVMMIDVDVHVTVDVHVPIDVHVRIPVDVGVAIHVGVSVHARTRRATLRLEADGTCHPPPEHDSDRDTKTHAFHGHLLCGLHHFTSASTIFWASGGGV